MYWFKQRFICGVALMVSVAALSSCGHDNKAAADTMKYFDIKGFFHADAARLGKRHPLISKSVEHNGSIETKKVYIHNWENELSLFITSDINKPGWKDSYDVTSTGGLTMYNAKDENLKTRRIIINQKNGKVKWMVIFNHTKNLLYESSEKLSYFPDSLYLIEKRQFVRVLGIHRYRIQGFFVNDGLSH